MNNTPLVSAIVIFLNAEQLLAEAIESVFAQTYEHWELLLVDDGSTDGSTDIARAYAAQFPGKVYYLAHEGRRNRGKSASRNLGIARARGDYVAFLDADDVWLPHKLEEQVAILAREPRASMVYGRSQWWYSWTGRSEDGDRDYVHDLGVSGDTLVESPELFIRFFVRQEAAIPCPCDILVRRAVFDIVGGFDEGFRGANDVYEDQTFYAKVTLNTPVFVADECWAKYRQHPASSCAVVEQTGQEYTTRRFFLQWLLQYVAQRDMKDTDIWRRLRRQLWTYRFPLLQQVRRHLRTPGSTAKALLLVAARRILPTHVRQWLWARLQPLRLRPPVGWVRLGSLNRVTPISRDWGFDRGNPVDRYYIEAFLDERSTDIRGRVLEVSDNVYTRRIGGDRVTTGHVLDVSDTNPKATVIADLTDADHLASNTFDCVIVTQTLQLIYDVPAAIRTLYRILAPGGVLLVTVPGISQISRYDMDRWGHYWSFTNLSARRLFEEVFPAEQVEVTAYGNVLAAVGFLHGLATQELRTEDLDQHDPDYEVIIAVRAVKSERGG